MQQFIARFEKMIQGVVSGFDRLLFRGSLRKLNHAHGMEVYLYMNDILLFKDYAEHVKGLSQRIKQASIAPILKQELPVRYLQRGDLDKDQLARQIAAERRRFQSGDVCVSSATELAPAFRHEGTHMVIRKRPSLALYHYLIHPEFGWMYARLQTWFPFTIHIYINGREWLARRMDREGLDYVRQDNCFPWTADYRRAQQFLDKQRKTSWATCWKPFVDRLNPLHREIFGKFEADYYWTVPQCEWATDIVFQPGALERLSPRFLEHGMLSFSSPDVMQFLGRKSGSTARYPRRWPARVPRPASGAARPATASSTASTATP